jgi:hypothetical protein
MRRANPPSQMQPQTHYRSLADFYRADPRRLDSRELDVGLWWREEADGPLHRAAWVDDTGELYLAHLGPEVQGGGQVEVLATVSDRGRLEGALPGWRERCGGPGSLSWLRRRTAMLRRFSSPGGAPARRPVSPPRGRPTRQTAGTAA